MRRFVLLASLLCSQALLTGCFTGGNLMIMSSLDRERIEEVETPIAQASALRVSEDRIEVLVRYADGAQRGVRLEPSSGSFSAHVSRSHIAAHASSRQP